MVFNVYTVSLGGTEKKLRSFEKYEDAIAFCEAHEWSWLNPIHPNGYEWDLMIAEEEAEE